MYDLEHFGDSASQHFVDEAMAGDTKSDGRREDAARRRVIAALQGNTSIRHNPAPIQGGVRRRGVTHDAQADSDSFSVHANRPDGEEVRSLVVFALTYGYSSLCS